MRVVPIEAIPPKPRRTARGLAAALRNLQANQALQVKPPAGTSLSKLRGRISSSLSQARHPGRRFHTRAASGSIWVWWEVEE